MQGAESPNTTYRGYRSQVHTPNSFIRFRSNFPEITLFFSIGIYLLGIAVFSLNYLIKSLALFIVLKRKIWNIRFVNFYLGVLFSAFPNFLSILINIFVPILIVKPDKSVNYSILSIGYILSIELQQPWLQIAINPSSAVIKDEGK
jgi:hypothetical protein